MVNPIPYFWKLFLYKITYFEYFLLFSAHKAYFLSIIILLHWTMLVPISSTELYSFIWIRNWIPYQTWFCVKSVCRRYNGPIFNETFGYFLLSFLFQNITLYFDINGKFNWENMVTIVKHVICLTFINIRANLGVHAILQYILL